MRVSCVFRCFFFFNDTATTEISTLSLHDALPICAVERREDPAPVDVADDDHGQPGGGGQPHVGDVVGAQVDLGGGDRKSTRLNSSHANISYAVFCLKKKTRRAHPQGAPRLPACCG